MKKKKKKCRNGPSSTTARDHLLSILHDVEQFVHPLLSSLQLSTTTTKTSVNSWPIVCNERCGSWYGHAMALQDITNKKNNSPSNIPPTASCYFKSTDGHYGTWNFSLKRLNLPLIRLASESGGCFILDSSKRKVMPDSMSRTIPIWCAVMNRLVRHFRLQAQNLDLDLDVDTESWSDQDLYTPPSSLQLNCDGISNQERVKMLQRIQHHVSTALQEGGLRTEDLHWMAQTFTKPLRPYWIVHHSQQADAETAAVTALAKDSYGHELDASRFTCVVCVSCSDVNFSSVTAEMRQNDNALYGNFNYIPGAADDHELWARGLTPTLFWLHRDSLLLPPLKEDENNSIIQGGENNYIRQEQQKELEEVGGSSFSVAETAAKRTMNAIDALVKQASQNQEEWYLDLGGTGTALPTSQNNQVHLPNPLCSPRTEHDRFGASRLGGSNLFLGGRIHARYPQCWCDVDAILNVSAMEDFSNNDHEPSSVSASSSPPMRDDGKVSADKYYLQLPVKQGKKDRTGLEKYLPLGVSFVLFHAVQGRRILVHCCHGTDRSVALVMAVLALCYNHVGRDTEGDKEDEPQVEGCDGYAVDRDGQKTAPAPAPKLKLHPWCTPESIASLGLDTTELDPPLENEYGCSGMPTRIVENLLGRRGRNVLFSWIRQQQLLQYAQSSSTAANGNIQNFQVAPTPLATKTTLRQTLHLIQEYHERASPSRNTMQKLHRFFMSAGHEEEQKEEKLSMNVNKDTK